MISKYFSYQHNFTDIIINDPVKSPPRSDFWHLESTPTPPPWSWRENIFSDSEIERILVIGKRLRPVGLKLVVVE